MKSWKFKILFPVSLITIAFVAKLVVWDFPVSNGKRVGNLVKISQKGKLFKTWEGTIDEGSGDKLTSFFSVRNDELGEQLYDFEGKKVVIYYEEYIVGWPWDTKYNVTSWKPQQEKNNESQGSVDLTASLLSKTLFCSMLGSLYKNADLYQKVKEFLKEDNLYLYNQYDKCNE
jgi:hypothetical protein